MEEAPYKETKTRDGYGLSDYVIMAIFVLVVMVVLIAFIAMSRFIAHESFPFIFLLFGLILAYARGSQMLKGEVDYRYLIIFALLLLLGAYLISLHNVNYAWWGAVILIVAFLADAGYAAYMKWSKKQEVNNMIFWGGLVSDVVLAILLLLAVIRDM